MSALCDWCKRPESHPLHSNVLNPYTWHGFRSEEQRLLRELRSELAARLPWMRTRLKLQPPG